MYHTYISKGAQLCDTVFYMKTNVLQDFHVCISVPLKAKLSDPSNEKGNLHCSRLRTYWNASDSKRTGTFRKKLEVHKNGICSS